MASKYSITALGELLIDFTEVGTSQNGQKMFERNPGGAPANVLVAARKLGATTAFIGKVGDDMHGAFLRDTLAGEDVDTTGLILDPNVFTTLAFVALDERGERAFSFARKPGADTCLNARELALDVIDATRVFHVGSLSLTNEPARGATLAALDRAREAGCVLSYDPNYRSSLWASAQVAQLQMRSIINRMDLMKISDEECELLTGTRHPEKAAETLLEKGVKVAVVTLGGAGAYVRCAQGGAYVEGFPTDIVDTTGAGDSFWGGFLTAFCESGVDAADVTLEQACGFARFGNAVASLCVRGRGAIPSMPTRGEVEALLAQQQ